MQVMEVLMLLGGRASVIHVRMRVMMMDSLVHGVRVFNLLDLVGDVNDDLLLTAAGRRKITYK